MDQRSEQQEQAKDEKSVQEEKRSHWHRDRPGDAGSYATSSSLSSLLSVINVSKAGFSMAGACSLVLGSVSEFLGAGRSSNIENGLGVVLPDAFCSAFFFATRF